MTREEELTTYLYRHIPLSETMGVAVVAASTGHVKLSAKFEPNINHQCTVFGGSASAVAILAAWTLVHLRLKDAGLSCDLVIQRNSMEYLQPFAKDFVAEACFLDEGAWESFLKLYQRRGKARLLVPASLFCEGEAVGVLEGAFVAISREKGVRG